MMLLRKLSRTGVDRPGYRTAAQPLRPAHRMRPMPPQTMLPFLSNICVRVGSNSETDVLVRPDGKFTAALHDELPRRGRHIDDRKVAQALHELHLAGQVRARIAGVRERDMFGADADLGRCRTSAVGSVPRLARSSCPMPAGLRRRRRA